MSDLHRRDLPRQGYIAVAIIMASILTAFDVRTAPALVPLDLRGAFGLGFDEGAWLSTFATAPQILVAPVDRVADCSVRGEAGHGRSDHTLFGHLRGHLRLSTDSMSWSRCML